MQVSAEIRWFWRTTPSPDFEAWFREATPYSCPAGGGQLRTDEYLRDPNQDELGLKRRGDKPGVEVKGKVAIMERGLAAEPWVGPIELWTKWTSKTLKLDSASTVTTEKVRWLRKFDTSGLIPEEIPLNDKELPVDAKRQLPSQGSNVELTQVKLLNSEAGEVWWTFGLEAFGTIQTVEDNLRKVADALAARRPPSVGEAELASYPLWLARYLK